VVEQGGEKDTLWFLPFESQDRTLRSASSIVGDGTELQSGNAFTVSLETVRVVNHERTRPIWEQILLGAKPAIDRVHYYRHQLNPDQPLLVQNLLADAICVCDDYQPPDRLYLELKVVVLHMSALQDDTTAAAIQTLLNTAGAVFPVMMPYAALGTGLVAALGKLWDRTHPQESWSLSRPINLWPPKTPRAKTLRAGQYVVFSEEIAGAGCQLADNGVLLGKVPDDVSYAVFRVDPSKWPMAEFVTSQRVATLLTQLKNSEAGLPAGALQTSLGYLTDTLQAYTNFKNLERYQELKSRPTDQLTQPEQELLQKLVQRPELAPFIR
jgi:hypothetical protein